jgi:hypothetical protein
MAENNRECLIAKPHHPNLSLLNKVAERYVGSEVFNGCFVQEWPAANGLA